MSNQFTFDSGFTNPDTGFTIKRLENCRIVIGQVPISDFQMVIHGFSCNAKMAADLANKMGVAFVIGEPEDLERLRQGLTVHINQPEDINRLKQSGLPISANRINAAEMAIKQNYPISLTNWLVNGDRGLSSDAMCQAMFGIPKGQPITNHPEDPSDLIRCLKFLKAAGSDELWRTDALPAISLEWALLKKHWEELESALISEIGSSFDGKEAPKTYGLMKSIFTRTHLSCCACVNNATGLKAVSKSISTTDLTRILETYHFHFATEKDLQDGIERALVANGIGFKREQSISKSNRPDFLIGSIAVEVKTKGTLSALLRQIGRYASQQEVESILVVGSPRWIHAIPKRLSDKEVHSLRLIGSLL